MGRQLAKLCAACALLGASLGAGAGCAGGSETGNPAVPMPIGLSVRSSDETRVNVHTASDTVVIDQAWVAFGPFDFVRGERCAMLDEIGQTAPTLLVADLAAPGVEIEVRVEPRDYCGLVIPLERHTRMVPAGAPAELEDHSIVVRGTRMDGTPFELAWPEQEELDMGGIDGLLPVREGDRLLFAFDVAVWMEGLDLDGATVSDDGVIRIDEANNSALLLVFEENVECSLELFLDVDGDGAVGADDELLAVCVDAED